MSNSAVLLTDKTKLAQGAFRVFLSSDQLIATSVQTKIQFNTKDYDLDGWFDNITNFRYTPQKAGKYTVSCVCGWEISLTINVIHVSILKNGTRIATCKEFSEGNTSVSPFNCVVTEVDMNGSTDFLEAFALQQNSSTDSINILSSNNDTHFFGHLIGE